MNIYKSIKSRFRNFKAKHFDLFPEGRKLKKLKNRHEGKRCFIVGNGPSLRADDLTTIANNGDISFAFNRIFHIFPNTVWRPTYYISQDEKILAGYEKEVERIPADIKFIPIEFEWYYGIKKMKGIQQFHIVSVGSAKKIVFSERIEKQIILWWTVVYSAIQMAVYMGIKEIYLIGVDHHFHTSVDKNGRLVIDPTAKDYFCDEYNADKENLWVPCTESTTFAYMAAKEYADSHGIKIYNATRGGKLEVFPRVDFDKLFQA